MLLGMFGYSGVFLIHLFPCYCSLYVRENNYIEKLIYVLLLSGSQRANEEFAELPPHEAKKRLATMVDRMDQDKDGYVSQQELSNWITKSFVSVTLDLVYLINLPASVLVKILQINIYFNLS